MKYRDGFTVNIIVELAGETRGAPYFKPRYPDLKLAQRAHGGMTLYPTHKSLGSALAKLNNVVLLGRWVEITEGWCGESLREMVCGVGTPRGCGTYPRCYTFLGGAGAFGAFGGSFLRSRCHGRQVTPTR